jgi:N6-adenosine-specific RNA methylase IME4
MTITDQALAKLQPPPGAPASAWAIRITACWQASVKAILEVGRLLMEAKAAVPGEFGKMIASDLPFTARTAQMLMAISADPRLTDAKHVSHLPASWGTMYQLTKLDDATFAAKVAEGAINPDIERADVIAIRKAAVKAPERKAYEDRIAAGCSVQDLNDLIDKGQTFETILADPPWDFETYSEKGQDRSPEYKTTSIDRIKALPVKQLAAENSSLHLWVLMNQLPEALEVIEAWGFTFKTCGFAWMKQNKSGNGLFMGMGYWTRANVELCLLATKGNPRRFDMGVPQALLSPLMEHSRKPDEFHERIERLVQGPYLELYARRERKGWVTWGNEIPRANFVNMAAADPGTGEIVETVPAAEASPEPDGIPDFLRRHSVPVASPREAQSVNAETTG